jgi:hypothetical protein
LSSVSPWSHIGISSSTIGKASILWLIVMQIVASAMGGYLAGRLRTKWVSIHTDEVYFRDTAHGLLAWAVGLVLTAAFLGSAASSMVGESAAVGPVSAASANVRSSDSEAYFVDSLFRSDSSRSEASDGPLRAEVGRILANALRQRDLSPADKTYLVQLVMARTGLSQPDAEKRVSGVFAESQQALDAARKEAAHLLLWLFIALLIGAFCASYAATLGGRQRDHVKAV